MSGNGYLVSASYSHLIRALSPYIPTEQPSLLYILMRLDRFDMINALIEWNYEEETYVCVFVDKAKTYNDRLGNMGGEFPMECAIEFHFDFTPVFLQIVFNEFPHKESQGYLNGAFLDVKGQRS